MKCNPCQYSDITQISFYDDVVQRCNACGYIRTDTKQFDNLLFRACYQLNVGNIKAYLTVDDLPRESLQELRKFEKITSINTFKIDEVNQSTCNVCRSKLHEFKSFYYPKFKILYCIDCNSIYFKRLDFEEFIEFAAKKSKPFSLVKFIKEIFHIGGK